MYATATAGNSLLPKLRNARGTALSVRRLSLASLLAHATQHSERYAAALHMPEEMLEDTAESLTAACGELVERPLHEEVTAAFLERAFSDALFLAAKCGAPHAETNLQSLRKRWDEHREAKRARRAAGGAAAHSPRHQQQRQRPRRMQCEPHRRRSLGGSACRQVEGALPWRRARPAPGSGRGGKWPRRQGREARPAGPELCRPRGVEQQPVGRSRRGTWGGRCWR